MESNGLYSQMCSIHNLLLAYKKARKGKTKKIYVLEFEKDTIGNLFRLQKELIEQNYNPKPLVTFILRDPKTRKISKSAFRDRIIHHALVRIIEPIFEKIFIYDSCANRIGKGNLFALKRFNKFKRKITNINKSDWNIKNKLQRSLVKEEITLVKKISDFPEIVISAGNKMNPALIANYSFELCQIFNEFYHNCPVLNDKDKSEEAFRIRLVNSFRIALENSLHLLGIEVMDEM